MNHLKAPHHRALLEAEHPGVLNIIQAFVAENLEQGLMVCSNH